jgi:hypothetical protein
MNSTIVALPVGTMSAMEVFILHHVHTFDDGDEDTKLIGVYSSQDTATAAIKRLRQQPGFCDVPEGFIISRYVLDVDQWAAGYATISSAEEQ